MGMGGREERDEVTRAVRVRADGLLVIWVGFYWRGMVIILP